MDDVRNPALEHAIAGDLERRENCLVYADWLASRGHARGELILAQDALASDPENPELLAAQQRLLEEHRDTFSCADTPALARVEVDWHRGFWRALRVELELDATTSAGIEALLAHPSAALLESLTIHGGLQSRTAPVYGNVATLLSKAVLPAVRTLRALALGSRDVPLHWAPAMFADSLPRLEHLEMRASYFEHRQLDLQLLPRLRSFTLLARRFDRQRIKHLTRSLPTDLRGLTIDTWDSDPDNQDIHAILDGSTCPHLTRLGVLGLLNAAELIAALRRSPLLPQLREIGLRVSFAWRSDEQLLELLRDPAFASKQLFTSTDASAAEHYHLATFLRAGLRRPADALVFFEAALRDDPKRVDTWMEHGLAHAELGQQPEAERSYREALQLEPDDVYTWHNLALCLKRQQRYAEALDAFRRAELPSERMRGARLHCIGHMLQLLGEHDEAQLSLEAAIDCYTQTLRTQPERRGAVLACGRPRTPAATRGGARGSRSCDRQQRALARGGAHRRGLGRPTRGPGLPRVAYPRRALISSAMAIGG